MPVTSTPDPNWSGWLSWAGVAYDDPFAVTSHDNRIVAGEELVDHQSVTLTMRKRLQLAPIVAGAGLRRGTLTGFQQTATYRALTKYKKASQTVTDSTGLVNDSHLFATLRTGRVYRIDARLFVTSVVSSGIRLDFGNSLATINNLIVSGVFFQAAAMTEAQAAALTTVLGATALVTRVDLAGLIELKTNGKVGLRFAQNAETIAAESVTLLRGSNISFTEILS